MLFVRVVHRPLFFPVPLEMKRIVQLDLDLKYRTNIRDLFQQFKHFPPAAVIGIVREMQPVYRYYTHTHIHTPIYTTLVYYSVLILEKTKPSPLSSCIAKRIAEVQTSD